ncbi:hypothetical protein [Pseudomonas fluorescens]|uniref:Uncharacterized protein n=1 Tax=Pseudomonas fluorescens TaxID=294 RepID=A0A5E7C992_PSEFL|nr:hypothetical protein [Pseudomonas fluorescens]VVN92533.1 hypothetical protein PS691_01981 [Pseudomonas fluorescens]
MSYRENKTQALADLEEATDDIRRTDNHAERLEALYKAQGMLYMLWRIDWVNSDDFEKLKVKLLQADADAVRQIEETVKPA